MPNSQLRFTFAVPDADPVKQSGVLRAALDMAHWGDQHGVDGVSLDEHHATGFGWSSNPILEGGMILAEDPKHLALMRLARAHGLTSGTFERKHARAPTYDVVSLGYNYRLDEFRAAIGVGGQSR